MYHDKLLRTINNMFYSLICDNYSLWFSDTIWGHRTGSTLAHVMACCLMAPLPEPINLSSIMYCGIHLRTILLAIFKISVTQLHLKIKYHQTSNISGINSKNFSVSRLVLQLSCPIHWRHVLSQEWSWSSTDRWCSNYIWMISNFVAC